MMNELWGQLRRAYDEGDYNSMHVLAKAMSNLIVTTGQIPDFSSNVKCLQMIHMIWMLAANCHCTIGDKDKSRLAQRSRKAAETLSSRLDAILPEGQEVIFDGEGGFTTRRTR